MRFLFEPFTSPDRKPNWLIIALFAVINGIVVYNCNQHEYTIGYDADDHLTYARVLSEGRLPTPSESMEFFCPPLPYAPAAVMRGVFKLEDEESLKKGKELQAIYSFVLTFFLLKLCMQITPDPRVRVWTLLLLGMIPAYYRSFVMIRGEPMLAMWAVVGMWLAVRTFVDDDATWRQAAALGFVLAGAALSRQWGILLFPAIGFLALYRAWVVRKNARHAADAVRGSRAPGGHEDAPGKPGGYTGTHPSARRILAHLAIAASICAIVGGSFYLHLRNRYGSTTAFNRAPTTAPLLRRHPASFYLDFPIKTLVTEPVKHKLAERLVPIFYSDLWGDYWCYCAVYARTRGREFRGGMRRSNSPNPKADIVQTNYPSMSRYLGRQNVVAIIPSLVLLGGVGVSIGAMIRSIAGGEPPPRADQVTAFLGICVLCSFGGYLVFLIAYPSDTGDTVKATYMLQALPPLAVLGALLLARIQDRWPRAFRVLAVLLIGAAAHGSYAFFTRYV